MVLLFLYLISYRLSVCLTVVAQKGGKVMRNWDDVDRNNESGCDGKAYVLTELKVT